MSNISVVSSLRPHSNLLLDSLKALKTGAKFNEWHVFLHTVRVLPDVTTHTVKNSDIF